MSSSASSILYWVSTSVPLEVMILTFLPVGLWGSISLWVVSTVFLSIRSTFFPSGRLIGSTGLIGRRWVFSLLTGLGVILGVVGGVLFVFSSGVLLSGVSSVLLSFSIIGFWVLFPWELSKFGAAGGCFSPTFLLRFLVFRGGFCMLLPEFCSGLVFCGASDILADFAKSALLRTSDNLCRTRTGFFICCNSLGSSPKRSELSLSHWR